MGLRIFGIIFSSIFAFGTGLIGYSLSDLYFKTDFFQRIGDPFSGYRLFASVLFGVLGIIVGFLIGTMIYRRITEIGKGLRRIPAEDKIACTLGTLLALIPAFMLGSFILKITDVQKIVLFALILLETVLVVWLGNVIALSMKDELKFLMLNAGSRTPDAPLPDDRNAGGIPKLLDTNVIIDGRIYDICRSGFLDGPIVLPGFVLEELHHIADSADALRRNRGRRGLDILHQMQTELDSPLRMLDRYKVAFAPGDGVDIKLVKLGKQMGADIVTNDYNLNKVAKLHGVRVLNVNELANAVKPVVLPGEELHVNIVREGKEYNQGVGYLDDGTMVVVENGKKMLGDTVTVAVSSVLQTVAGKMIFAELKFEHSQEESDENSGYYAGRGNRRKTY